MKAALQQEITATFDELYKTISLFTEEEINKIPFEGSWTPGQVIRHIIKSISGLRQLSDGTTQKIRERGDENIPAIKSIFLDFTTKMKSPDYIYPEDQEYDKNELVSSLQKIEKEMLDISQTYDLTLSCVDAEFPSMGNLTIYEWIIFSLVHTQRHSHQLKNIYDVM